MCRELKRQGLTKKRRQVAVKRRHRAGAKINQKSPCVEGKRSLRSNGTPLSQVCSQEALKSTKISLMRCSPATPSINAGSWVRGNHSEQALALCSTAAALGADSPPSDSRRSCQSALQHHSGSVTKPDRTIAKLQPHPLSPFAPAPTPASSRII